MKKGSTEPKSQILAVAEQLFQDQGYMNTTIEEIVKAAQCSKGTFYYYFEGKEEIAGIPDLYDQAYADWYDEARTRDQDALSLLREFNRVYLTQLEAKQDLERSAAVCRYEISTKNKDVYIGSSRVYNHIIQSILQKGQAANTVRTDVSFMELSHIYSMTQRGIVFDWCICNGTYSLLEFGTRPINMLLCGFAPGSDLGL